MPASSFSAYDMAISYPKEWTVNLERDSDFDHGGLDILAPSKRAMVTVLWRPKEQLIRSIEEGERPKKGFLKLFPKPPPKKIDLGSTSLLDAYREIVWYKLREEVKNVELINSKEVEINGHRAYLEQIIFKTTTTFLILKRVRGIIRRIQLLLVCDETGRTFAIFGSTLDSDFKEFESTINEIILSFKCHMK